MVKLKNTVYCCIDTFWAVNSLRCIIIVIIRPKLTHDNTNYEFCLEAYVIE